MRDSELYRPRWRHQPGRLEKWYAALTDPPSCTVLWLHHEIVAPTSGASPYAHGWVAVFPHDAPPAVERFGPSRVSLPPEEPEEDDTYFATPEVSASPGALTGTVGRLRYRLELESKGEPLFTMPHWVWRHEAFSNARYVPAPAAAFTGIVDVAGQPFPVMDAPGEVARMYGQGNARRWAWLHADLGGGDVLEIVVAAANVRRARLPPLTFVQLRCGGRDWPADPLLAAPLFRSRVDMPEWSVQGAVGRRRLRVRVRQEDATCVRLTYHEPDGSTATCANTERAMAEIVLERWAGTWRLERRWNLLHTAHAEVGTKP